MYGRIIEEFGCISDYFCDGVNVVVVVFVIIEIVIGFEEIDIYENGGDELWFVVCRWKFVCEVCEVLFIVKFGYGI